jgi:hypothetical protein
MPLPHACHAYVFPSAFQTLGPARRSDVQVFGNKNRIPYYTANVEDPSHLSTMHGNQSGYGQLSQASILDGSGIYVSSNAESYSHGWFDISDNVCHSNGIDGATVYATRRVAVHGNVARARSEH